MAFFRTVEYKYYNKFIYKLHAWTLNGSVNIREICHWHDNAIYIQKVTDLTDILVGVHWEEAQLIFKYLWDPDPELLHQLKSGQQVKTKLDLEKIPKYKNNGSFRPMFRVGQNT